MEGMKSCRFYLLTRKRDDGYGEKGPLQFFPLLPDTTNHHHPPPPRRGGHQD